MEAPNRKLANLLSDDSFVRWVKGVASEPERRRWEAWEQELSVNRQLKASSEMFFQMRMEAGLGRDLELQLNRLNRRIDQAESSAGGTVPGRFWSVSGSIRGYGLAIASAVVLLLAIVGGFYFYQSANVANSDAEALFATMEVGYGETGSLKFSDGSIVQLNSKSALKYRTQKSGGGRIEVWLEGEGYFDVVSNPNGEKREFVVHTPDGDVNVLGTKFNVSTRFRKTSVVLEEGRVEVSMKDTVQNIVNGRVLEPGERAVFSRSSSDIVLQKVDVGMFTAWLDGEMEFDGTSLSEIIASVEATYGVKLQVGDAQLLERRITGTIQNPDLQNLLTGLKQILDLEIRQTSNKEFMITQQSIQKE